MKTELEIKMETCPHKLVELRMMGFPEAENGWYCTLCGCTIQGNKIIPATSWSKPVDGLQKQCLDCSLPAGHKPPHANPIDAPRMRYEQIEELLFPDRQVKQIMRVEEWDPVFSLIVTKINEIIRKLNSL